MALKAIILAAGKGTRLKPITNHTPKALISVNGECLIEKHLYALKLAGYQEIIVNLCHLGELIEQKLKDGTQYGLKITYSKEYGKELETAGGIKQALPMLGNQPFLVINADILTDFSFDQLPKKVKQAHLILAPNPKDHSGDFNLRADLLTNEKPSPYTYCGIGVYSPAFFSEIPDGKIALGQILRKKVDKKQITGEVYEGVWHDIGTTERLRAVTRLSY
jgi:MurNAc alpha-1-phosphate uridylyltransferase